MGTAGAAAAPLAALLARPLDAPILQPSAPDGGLVDELQGRLEVAARRLAEPTAIADDLREQMIDGALAMVLPIRVQPGASGGDRLRLTGYRVADVPTRLPSPILLQEAATGHATIKAVVPDFLGLEDQEIEVEVLYQRGSDVRERRIQVEGARVPEFSPVLEGACASPSSPAPKSRTCS